MRLEIGLRITPRGDDEPPFDLYVVPHRGQGATVIQSTSIAPVVASVRGGLGRPLLLGGRGSQPLRGTATNDAVYGSRCPCLASALRGDVRVDGAVYARLLDAGVAMKRERGSALGEVGSSYRLHRSIAWFATVVALVACDDTAPLDDAGMAGMDASTGDGDGDGVPASLDCDDSDPSITSSATRSCMSDCALGTESCSDGSWSACSASTDCTCETPGEMRTVDCGRCGVASQRCGTDGSWETPSECFSEQDCFAGEIERDVAMCGQRARICNDTCHWLPWETTVEPGECEPGATQRSPDGCTGSQTREETCSTECVWEPTGTCEVACISPPAPSRSGADTVCIPAGDFILGWNSEPTSAPELTVTLSEFHVDRVLVTKARYDMCVADGGCTPAANPEYYDIGDGQFYANGVTWDQAFAFCEWDGGELITEFQWEKAARGAAPDRRLRPWGDEVGTGCMQHPDTGCLDDSFAVTDFPASVSPWGVRLLGSTFEWTNSEWADRHVDVPPVDPTGNPVVGTAVTLRGHGWGGPGGPFTRWSECAVRRRGEGRGVAWRYGFRCVY
ncbi:MAG: SUMF1/EgtB/PvdO family nonheme iron enzyme [Sandaracinaceae bacterium]|nr:SUMF1/EgtB/PvdO family nonheme iron enzyme [Sandaracinaceae bacterium]